MKAMKAMKDIKAVRCGSSKPTPFLRKNIELFTECDATHVIDIGCGNGRNSKYFSDLGMHVMSLDGKGDYGIKWVAGSIIPTESGSADIILCNYVLMFLEQRTRNDVYKEIKRISHVGSKLMIELENVKQSLIDDEDKLAALNEEVVAAFSEWKLLKKNKNHYIFERAA